MSILALDLATKTGYAVLRDDSTVVSGTIKLHPRAKEGDGARYIRLRRWLVEIKQAEDVTELVYESVMGHGAFAVIAAHVYGGLLATLQAFGEHHGIPYRGIGVSTIKKQFAGHGKATKQAVIDQCRELGFNPQDDNEADAIALLHVATGRCPILLPTGLSTKRTPRRQQAPMPADGAPPF